MALSILAFRVAHSGDQNSNPDTDGESLEKGRGQASLGTASLKVAMDLQFRKCQRTVTASRKKASPKAPSRVYKSPSQFPWGPAPPPRLPLNAWIPGMLGQRSLPHICLRPFPLSSRSPGRKGQQLLSLQDTLQPDPLQQRALHGEDPQQDVSQVSGEEI